MFLITRSSNPKDGKNTIYLTSPDGSEIELIVVQTDEFRAKIGINAPKEINIIPGEKIPVHDNRGNK